jgi:four helix bundle protein
VNRVPFTAQTAERPFVDELFDFEKLQVYQLALDFLDELCAVCRALPGDFRHPFGNQVIRAALSISNNLAEGTGKRFKKEKAWYYSTAIDSARECISILNVLFRQKHIDEDQYLKLRETGRRITSMLYKLIRSIDETTQVG